MAPNLHRASSNITGCITSAFAMDLNTVTEIARPRRRIDLPVWRTGDAWLAGGTWLFSEPQPKTARLIDIVEFGWTALEITDAGLRTAATCKIAELEAMTWPSDWRAAPLFGQCCRAFLASFKVWNAATVGGNICLALPAGPMISLASALDGVCTIWSPDGSERRLGVTDFVLGPQRNALAPGELLRSIELPLSALRQRTAFRQISLSPLGRSAALLIGTLCPVSGRFALAVTASTPQPMRFAFVRLPTRAVLRDTIKAGIRHYYDDVHGHPEWRRHMTLQLAEEIRGELGEEDAA
jgi:CO/xanthine dehydrogenase FAD-binding subunit